MFAALVDYSRNYGNCNVPDGWRDNPQLATWVRLQRPVKKSGKLSKERIRRLEQIGFVWNPFDAQWDERYEEL